jgi:hypothetical protein
MNELSQVCRLRVCVCVCACVHFITESAALFYRAHATVEIS